MATLQFGVRGGNLSDFSVVAMIIWYFLSRLLIALECEATIECEATTNYFKPHRFIVSTNAFFFFT